MSFFDKKEEVLEFKLTEYGKKKLELGRFKPAFYAFFDDDILYNTEAAGFSEGQNHADRRIRFDTPALKVQKSTTGAETRVNQFLDDVSGPLQEKDSATGQYVISENSVDFVNVFQDTPQFAQKFFLGSDPLGTSDLKTQYAPAWHINALENEISSSQYYQTVNLTASNTSLADGIVRNIPQIDVTIDYKSFYSSDDEMDDFTSEEAAKIVRLTEDNDTGVSLYLQEDYLVLDVVERNTDNLKENFEIEVFLSGSDGTYTQKTFLASDNLDEDLSDQKVEFFANIFVDSEMPNEVIQRLGIKDSTLKGTIARTQLSRDLYTSDNEEPC
tara:strand:+ start:36478 stop:37461 length:984 start_codon:yes stop_codon:yes gene_type:complete